MVARFGDAEMHKIFVVSMVLLVAISPFVMIYWASTHQRAKRRHYYTNRYDAGDPGSGSGGYIASDGWSRTDNDDLSSGNGSFGGGGASGGWGDSGGGDSGGGGDGGGGD